MKMALTETVRKMLGRDEEFAEMQNQDRLQTKLQERKKNSNERELERFVEEERQEQIKKDLDGFRKLRQKQFFETTIFKQDDILKNDNPILKQKNIFLNKKMPKNKGMFFK